MIKRLLLAFVFLLLVALGRTAVADGPLILTDDPDEYPLGLYLEYLEDEEKTWTIDDVTSAELAPQFVRGSEEVPGFGFTDSAYWVRISAVNEAELFTSWLLWVKVNLFFLDVYLPAVDGAGYDVVQTGTARPFDTRDLDHPEFLFDLSLPPGEEQTIYARFESEGSLNLGMSIISVPAMAQRTLVEQRAYTFIYGALIVLIVYNLVLFFFLREASYIYYVLFFLAMLLALMWIPNFAHQYIWPEAGRFNAVAGQLLYVVSIIFALMFTDTFLRVPVYRPRLHKVLVGLIIVLALIIPLQFINLGWAGRFTFLFSMTGLIMMLASGFVIWRDGYKPARYFLLAWLMFLVVIGIGVFALVGLLPYNAISIWGIQLSIVVLALVLSFALADRVRLLRQQRESAQIEVAREQQEAIRLKDEYTRSIEDVNERLESEFEQRLRELSFAQAQIGTIFENSPLGIGTASLEGNILSANAAMARIFGYSEEEILQVNVDDFFPDDAIREALMQELMQERLIKAPMLQLQRKDGSLIYTNLTESLLSRADQDVLLGVVDDITGQVLAEQLLQERVEVEAIAAERTRIAGELHDSVTQTLYTSSLIAEALPKVWKTHPDEAINGLEELRNLSQGALAEMRTLLLELRPGDLAERSLSELLHQLTDGMSARTEIPITTTVIGNCELPTDVQIVFYRIAQEGLNNVSKHARASRAAVSLNCQDGRFELRISDNGRGFDSEINQPHELGLRIMRDRAEAIGADIVVNSSVGKGTEIAVSWQFSEGQESEDGQN